MAQWMNLHRNNSFVNWTRLPLLCEKSGVILLVLMGLTAGSPGRQSGRQSEKYWQIWKFLKFSTDHIARIFMVFNEGTVLLPMHSVSFFG